MRAGVRICSRACKRYAVGARNVLADVTRNVLADVTLLAPALALAIALAIAIAAIAALRNVCSERSKQGSTREHISWPALRANLSSA